MNKQNQRALDIANLSKVMSKHFVFDRELADSIFNNRDIFREHIKLLDEENYDDLDKIQLDILTGLIRIISMSKEKSMLDKFMEFIKGTKAF